MSSEEKKFKLDELPDKGSEPEIKPSPASKKEKPEPRIQKIKAMSDKERVEALTQRWYFDKPRMRWGWLIALLILFGLEKSGHMKKFQTHREKDVAETDGMMATMIEAYGIDTLLKHPLYLAILIPLFFKFRESSKVFFEITFDGIISVRSIKEAESQEPFRVTVKWNDITEVRMAKSGDQDILVIYTGANPVMELIWDIDEVKKKVVKQVVKGLVSQKNPFREFIEKEVA